MATEVLPMPGTDPLVELEQEHSADAAAEVQLPSLDTGKQPEQQPEPVNRGIYFVRVPRPALDDTSHTINKLETELSGCFTKLKSINNKFQVKKVLLQGARGQGTCRGGQKGTTNRSS